MKKLLIIITTIAVLGILASVGFFGYNKYQEVELEKDELNAQQKDKSNDNDNEGSGFSNPAEPTAKASETGNNTEENQDNTQQQANDGSETVEVSAGGTHRTVNKSELAHFRINRDNVFDYVIAAVNQTEGGDASLIKFQQPTFNEQGDGIWKIAANNKSGVGAYTFIVDQDGTVTIYNGTMDEVIDKQKVTLN
ncbi:hypothetical protein [Staphylococcus debuckii]|uniref:Lipoprotein n=1 Tax=Staphylococcus debuckii TaxID=2044912 RepID=A0ABU9EUR2_9STAP